MKVPAVLVLLVWTSSSFLACLGAAYLACLAFRDWRLVSADTRDMRKRSIRRETSGILIRSGCIRTLTTFLFVTVGLTSAWQQTRPIPITTAIISSALAVLTAAITFRDLVARSRIAKASS